MACFLNLFNRVNYDEIPRKVYLRRSEIFNLMSDEQLYRRFRFDRETIRVLYLNFPLNDYIHSF